MASLDRGSTQYVGIVDRQITSATSLATPDVSGGLASDSQSNPSLRESDRGSSAFAYATYRAVDPSAFRETLDRASSSNARGALPSPPGSSALYRMTGYVVASSTWVSWTSVGAPNAISPGGTTLPFTTYVVIAGGSAN